MTDHKFTEEQIIEALEIRMPHDAVCREAYDLINRQKAEIEKLEKLDELAERSIEASTAVINDLRSEVALLNDANTNLQDLYQAEKSKVLKKQEKLIMAYRKLQTAKSEAIKEFAKKIKTDAEWICDDNYIEDALIKYVDTLVEEMTETK